MNERTKCGPPIQGAICSQQEEQSADAVVHASPQMSLENRRQSSCLHKAACSRVALV